MMQRDGGILGKRLGSGSRVENKKENVAGNMDPRWNKIPERRTCIKTLKSGVELGSSSSSSLPGPLFTRVVRAGAARLKRFQVYTLTNRDSCAVRTAGNQLLCATSTWERMSWLHGQTG
ncbi:uncharacterized protein ACNS7B_017694 [Menidia menidia]